MDAATNRELLQVFGVDPDQVRLQEKTEVLLYRITPNRYVKKTGSLFVGDEKQCVKLEIYNGNRLSKSFQVFEAANSEVSQIAHDLFAKVCTSHLTDIQPATVNQYGGRK